MRPPDPSESSPPHLAHSPGEQAQDVELVNHQPGVPTTVGSAGMAICALFGAMEPTKITSTSAPQTAIRSLAPGELVGLPRRGLPQDEHLVPTLTKVLDDTRPATASWIRPMPAGRPAGQRQPHQLDHDDIGRDATSWSTSVSFSVIQIRRLDELVERDMLDALVARFVQASSRVRLSIVFAGPPDAGKTTLLTCAAKLDPRPADP